MEAEIATEASARRRVIDRGWEPHPATILMATAVVASGVLLLHWLSRLTFWRDEWDFLLHRRSWNPGTFFHPFVEQLVAIPVLIYKVLVTAFGMGSAAPFQLVATALFLLSVVLLFVYVRRRIGPWVALAAALPILFLGPSWDDLLFPFQMALFGSVACGLGALLALDRRDRTGDVVAAVLLVLALLFSDLGIPFVAGATVSVALTRERFARAYIVVIPTALWALWYLAWGHTAMTFVSWSNAANLPSYVADGFASSLSTILGLGVPRDDTALTSLSWGQPLLVLAIALAGWRLYRLGRVPHQLLTVSAIALGFWCLAGLNSSVFSAPTVGRYQYVGIVLLVLVATELVRGMRFGRYMVVGVVLVATAAAVSNLSQLRDSANGLAGIAEQERGGLAALELTRGRVDPGLELTQQNSEVDYLNLLDAGSYLSAVDAYGSPAYTPAELVRSPETARVAADKGFGTALGVHLTPSSGAPAGRCVAADPGSRPLLRRLPKRGLVMRAARPSTQVALRRYALESFPVALGRLPPGQRTLLRVPPDRSPQPWELMLSGGGPVSVCAGPSR